MAPADPARRGAAPPDPSRVPDAAALAVFLDVDGTLLALQERPEPVELPDSLRSPLDRLQRRDRAARLADGVEERRERWQTMDRRLETHDVDRWRESFVGQLARGVG